MDDAYNFLSHSLPHSLTLYQPPLSLFTLLSTPYSHCQDMDDAYNFLSHCGLEIVLVGDEGADQATASHMMDSQGGYNHHHNQNQGQSQGQGQGQGQGGSYHAVVLSSSSRGDISEMLPVDKNGHPIPPTVSPMLQVHTSLA